MIIQGLDGKEYSWNPSASQANSPKLSSLHIKAKILLDKLFPYDRILEEVSLVGSKTERRSGTLRADLFIPNRNLLIEVHGEQHYKFNKFFYKDKLSLIEFNYNEDVDDWRRKIK